MKKTLAPFFRFAMPFLQGSLVKQILVGLILGIALAYAWPSAASSVGILGTIFVNALKGVAPSSSSCSSSPRSPTTPPCSRKACT